MKSAKWIVLATALPLALGACTKAAESKDRGYAPQASAPQAEAPPAEVAPAAEIAPEAAPAVAPEAAIGAPGDVAAVAPEAAEPVAKDAPGKPKTLTAVKRSGGAMTLSKDVTVTKQYYTLEIKVPAAAAAGKPAEVRVTLVPKNGRHLNHEFPTKLIIDPPAGVTVAKPTLKKADAETFNDDLAAFKVSFTSTDAGEKAFSGKFKFAVCTDTTCDPMTEQLAFKVTVK